MGDSTEPDRPIRSTNALPTLVGPQARRERTAVPGMAETYKFFILGDPMKPLVVVWMLLAALSVLGAQPEPSPSLGEIKQWHMKARDGEVSLKLTSRPNQSVGYTVLSLGSDDAIVPTNDEQAHFLGQVLDEMPSLGYDPRKVEMISVWLKNTAYREGVQHSLEKSGKWKMCVGRKYCHEAEAVANQYLQSVDAFKSLDGVLGAHGLTRRTVQIDDMGVSRSSGNVSCSGLIIIALRAKD